MTVIGLLLFIALLGFLVWLILKIDMPAPLQSVIVGVAIVVVIVVTLQFFGVDTSPIPRLNTGLHARGF